MLKLQFGKKKFFILTYVSINFLKEEKKIRMKKEKQFFVY